MKTVTLRRGRESLAVNRHPWVYSGAVETVSADPDPGELVRVCDARGGFIAWGHFNSGSKIRLRLLEWDAAQSVDSSWYRRKLQASVAWRKSWLSKQTQACRWVYSEADGLPGLVVDQLGDYLVMQITSLGMEMVKARLADLLMELAPEVKGILERSEGDGRRMEGLAPVRDVLLGDAPPERISIVEHGLTYQVDPWSQKSGFYADQRENRLRVAHYAAERSVLDMCCYSGGFAMMALKHHARSACLCDVSSQALDMATANLEVNGLMSGEVKTIRGDAFQVLRDLGTEHQSFDLIVLDPPKLIFSRKDRARGLRGYKDLNLQAMKRLNPGGILVTFSCSGLMTEADFRQMLAFAAKDAGRSAWVLENLMQASDHPIRLSCPETAYLTGAVVRLAD